MNEKRRSAGRCQSGGDLSRHMAALADAGKNHSPACLADQMESAFEGTTQSAIEGIDELLEPSVLDLQGTFCHTQQ
jgi:hypothetical protein